MTTPLWVLLGFAAWTILILLLGVGISRWSKILSGRVRLNEFPGDTPHGSPRYRRAMRAHANCVENLPVYCALVVVMTATGLTSAMLDQLALVVMAARVAQSSVHILFTETSLAVAVRFTFFFMQILAMGAMGWEIFRSVS